MAYTPTTWANGDTITAAGLNKMEQGIAAGGLPAVTSSDNGDVLTVVNGAWDKAEPSVMTVFSEADPNSGAVIFDKNYQQIHDAMAAGKSVVCVVSFGNGGILTLHATKAAYDDTDYAGYYIWAGIQGAAPFAAAETTTGDLYFLDV